MGNPISLYDPNSIFLTKNNIHKLGYFHWDNTDIQIDSNQGNVNEIWLTLKMYNT